MFKNKGKIITVTIVALIVVGAIAIVRYLKVQDDKTKAAAEHIERGHSLFIKGDYDGAYSEYSKAWQIKPEITNHDEKNGAVNLAQIMTAKGELERAKELFLKAVTFDPYFYASYLFLGDIFLKEKNPEKALFYLEKGLSLQAHFIKDDPNAALLYYNIAEAYELLGNKDSAVKNYEVFIDISAKDKRLEASVAKAKDRIAKAKK